MPSPCYVPLTAERHGGLMWQRFTSYRFAQYWSQAPLAEQEVAQAAACLPVAFQQHEDGWQAVALLSLTDSENLLVDSRGRWLAAYVPAALRTHPFGLNQEAPGSLAIDESSDYVVERYDAEPLFNQAGELASFPQEVLAFLHTWQRGCQALSSKIALLHQHKLLSSWHPKGYKGSVSLYRINEPVWNRLDARTIGHLWEAGVLPLVYAQLLSQAQLSNLYKAQALQEEKRSTPTKEMQDHAKAVDALREAMGAPEEYLWPEK